MTFEDLDVEFHGLTRTRQLEVVDKMFKMIMGDLGRYEEFVCAIIEIGVEFESDDYFGTEGARL